jgi:succinate-semialdehyde dehydrogenase/glutarate-semialdehyde dehydrogenase
VDVDNPATGLKIGTVPKSGKAETRRAIEAADTAFATWRKTTALERSKLLRKLHDAMMTTRTCWPNCHYRAGQVAGSTDAIGSAAAYILWFAEKAAAPMATSCPRHGRTAASW